jgi:hypothetical protein
MLTAMCSCLPRAKLPKMHVAGPPLLETTSNELKCAIGILCKIRESPSAIFYLNVVIFFSLACNCGGFFLLHILTLIWFQLFMALISCMVLCVTKPWALLCYGPCVSYRVTRVGGSLVGRPM